LQRRLRKKERSVEDVPLMYFAFDLLFKNSVSFIERPLEERVMALESLKLEQPLTFSSRRLVNRIEEISEMFSESKSQGYEGLVVKDPNSSYTPGRRGRSWVKLKKELDTLDVVIVAAEYGHGKRAGVISDYTFAVRDGSDLKVIGKAYSGLTDLEIREMTDLLKSITEIDQGYRRIVKPKIVLEVAFDAIQKSERHDSGFALRFPRIKRIRWDKSPNEIDTLDKVRQIYESQRVRA
jgi:DNA ligase-1